MRTTRRSSLAATSAVSAIVLLVTGCGTQEVPGTPSVEGVEAVATTDASPPSTAGSTDPPGGEYGYIEGLCRQIDFSAVEDIMPFSEEMTENGLHTVPFSAASCAGRSEPPDGTPGSGTIWVDVRWLPTPRVAAEEYEDQLTILSGEADQLSELPGRWEHATLGSGNGISETAASILIQDSNILLAIRLSFTLNMEGDPAGPAVQNVADSILSLTRDAS